MNKLSISNPPEIFYKEGQKFIEKMIKDIPEIVVVKQDNVLSSFKPADCLWGYTYHSKMIPPYAPESVLILGYGTGQIADLIRKVWGNRIKITGVDLVPCEYQYIENKIEICDAYDFVKKCTNEIIKTRFDYVVIDLFDGKLVPDFIFQAEFIIRLKEIVKTLISINILNKDFEKLKLYHEYGFKYHRSDIIFGNNVSFWGI